MDINAVFKQIVTVFSRFTKQQKIVIISAIAVLLAFLAFLIIFDKDSTKLDDGYRVLFDNVTPQDAGLIIQNLETSQIPYKIENENTIKVPKDIVYEQRIKIAALGIPKNSRVGFELFDENQFGATSFDQNVKYLRALEGELSSTVEALNPIQKAKVHIALPKDSVFISKQIPPTASVIIHLNENMMLDPKQVRGIKSLIAASVAKLQPENVKIVNEHGDPLGENDELTISTELASTQLKYKKDYERLYEKKIKEMLSEFVGGPNSVVAKVTIDFDFTKVDTQKETFDPNSIVRSEQVMEENREGYRYRDIGGVPGAVSNIGPVKGIDDGDKKETYNKSQAMTNYEISKQVENIRGQFATITRITAAVVVDGKYKLRLDEESGNEILDYFKRDDAEIEAITKLVKQAVGFNEGRSDEVTVSNFRFNIASVKEPKDKYEQIIAILEPYLPFLKYVIAGLMLFIFYKMIIAPFAQKMLETPIEDDEKKAAIIKLGELEDEEEVAEQEADIRKRVEDSLGLRKLTDEQNIKIEVMFQKIKESVEEKPEEAAIMFTNLIKEHAEEIENQKAAS
jgi:flagellar M-ring protein FliF